MSVLQRLSVPVIAAPMAGGPSTPALTRAVAAGGGLGFLAGGTTRAEDLAEQMRDTLGAYGVNLFCPQNPYHDTSHIKDIAEQITPFFIEHGEQPPTVPEPDYTFGWRAKFDAIIEAIEAGHGPQVVSCTFGLFEADDLRLLHDKEVEAWVTVTNEHEAVTATEAGADALVVQGPAAGGHRATWHVSQLPDLRPLPDLVAAIAEESELPLIAAGGLATAEDIAEALTWPHVIAASCGTAFLLADEAGTNPLSRTLLQEAGRETVSTRAFSGRFARGLETEFTKLFDALPPSYPQLNTMLKPLRGKKDAAYCLAGERYNQAQRATAAEILHNLVG